MRVHACKEVEEVEEGGNERGGLFVGANRAAKVSKMTTISKGFNHTTTRTS
jgi:hypothetical protein